MIADFNISYFQSVEVLLTSGREVNKWVQTYLADKDLERLGEELKRNFFLNLRKGGKFRQETKERWLKNMFTIKTCF